MIGFRGALANLGQNISDQTVGNILKEHGIEPRCMMSQHEQPTREMFELAAAYRDETLKKDQRSRLQDLLQNDADAREYFLRFMSLHALLETRLPTSASELEDDDSTRAVPDGFRASVGRSRSRSLRFLKVGGLILAASLLIAVVGHLTHQPAPIARPRPNPGPIAMVSQLADVTWPSGADGFTLGQELRSGRIRLESGMMRLVYRHGVVVSVEGPAEYQILTADRAILHKGRLAAYVPEGAEGFRVTTPNAKVVDLGTEFGLTVSDGGETELSVFDGSVEITPALPKAKTTLVRSGQAYRVDKEGHMKPWSIGLAPYEEARDSLRGWRIIWEPFGDGSETGPFPGSAGAGWQGPWTIDVEGGALVDELTGIADKRSLYPGTEVYLRVAAKADGPDKCCRARASREFGAIDQFRTDEPYTIELLLRAECDPANISRINVFGISQASGETETPAWLLQAATSEASDSLAWQIGSREGLELRYHTLPVGWGMTFRCFIEVHPQLGQWRTTVSNRHESISNSYLDSIPLTGSADEPVILGFEVEGREVKEIRFSLDAIRIQNRPSASAESQSGRSSP